MGRVRKTLHGREATLAKGHMGLVTILVVIDMNFVIKGTVIIEVEL